MKKIILLLFIMVLFLPAIAQQKGSAKLDGIVYKFDSIATIDGSIVTARFNNNIFQDTTNSEGYYSFKNLIVHGGFPANYELTATATGFFPDTISLIITNGDSVSQDFYLEEAGKIEGTVMLNDELGLYGNIEDVLLELIIDNDTIQNTNPDTVSGYYEFDLLQAGEYVISTSLNNFQSHNSQVVIDSTEVEVVNISLDLVPGIISGYISMESMELITDVVVTISDDYDEVSPDPSGYYEFTDIEPGTYNILASLDGYNSEPSSYQNILLTPGGLIENMDFFMQYGSATISGNIKNEEDDAVVYAIVIVGDEETTTDEEGYYEIDNLPIEEVTIIVSAIGYITYSDNLVLNGGENQFNIVLVHEPLVYFENTVDTIEFDPTLIDSISVSKVFTVHGRYLNADLNLFANTPFEISLDSTGDYYFELHITLEPEESTIDAVIYARFSPVEKTNFHEYMILTSDGALNDTIMVTGDGIGPLVVDINSSESIVCSGDSVILTALVADGLLGTYSYEWTYNDDILSTDSVVVVDPIITSEYKLKVGDSLGNVDSTNKIIQIFQSVTITSNPLDTNVCAGKVVNFNIILNNDENVTYQWQGNNTDLENNSTYSGVNTNELEVNTAISINQDVYQCKITHCRVPIISQSALLTVHSLPIDTIIVKGEPPIVLISPDSGLIYQWYVDQELLVGHTNQFYYPSGGFKPGNYYVEIENDNGCTTTTKPIPINISRKNISVYPNPVSTVLFIDATLFEVESELKVTITDLAGRLLISEIINPNRLKTDFSLNRLKQGIYLIQIINNKGLNVYSSKIVKN